MHAPAHPAHPGTHTPVADFPSRPVPVPLGDDLRDTPWMRAAGPGARRHRPRPGQKRVNLGLISLYDIENNATRIMAACARRAGYRVVEIFFKDWVNNHFDPPRPQELDHLVRLVREHDLGLVGISIRASAYHKVACQLTRHLKRHCPGVTVLWGGTHVILDPRKCVGEADLVCRGEGDITLIQVLDRLSSGASLEDQPNLMFRRPDGTVVDTGVGPTVQDLDELPFRDYTSPDKWWILGDRCTRGDPQVSDPLFQMMNSRGCVFVCAYCYNSEISRLYKGKGRYFRNRSVDSVLREIRQAREIFPNMRRIRFDDEVFLYPAEWYAEFEERYPREVGLPFEIFIEPKLVKRDLFTRLRKAGLDVVYMGVQNTYRVTHELYDRYVTSQHIQWCAELFHELGIDARFQVILDDPQATSEDKRNLFDLLMTFPRPFELYLFSIVIFPNTALARRLLAEGRITEADIEGENTKTFQQMRVSLNYPRPPEDLFWASMLVLLNKNFLPKPFIYWLSDCRWLQRHPRVLAWFAQLCNLIKMGALVLRMARRGELSWTLIRRWANPNSLITS